MGIRIVRLAFIATSSFVLAGCASTHADTSQSRDAASHILFNPYVNANAGPAAEEPVTWRSAWPITYAYQEDGEALLYGERTIDRQGLWTGNDYYDRRFQTWRFGRGRR
jgi:hypothetical protein